jgi:hypothetical protein
MAACGPAAQRDNFGNDGGGSGGGGGGGGGGGSGSDGCSAASKLVYVVDQNNTLSQYDPTMKAFHDLGTLNCNAPSGYQPFSMGVDRNATAYVLFTKQSTTGTIQGTALYKVDTTSASLTCTKTTFTAPSNLTEFGMGFSTTTAGGDVDQLFIAGGTMPGTASSLNTLDVTTFTPTPVGAANNIAGDPELTGNSNGELWGFLPDATSPKIEQINKTNGNPISPANLPSTMQGTPLAWAFAFFGGNYYIFLMKDNSGGIFPETSTTVYEVSPTGQLMSTLPTNTRVIVGAGVSTCAPIVIQ